MLSIEYCGFKCLSRNPDIHMVIMSFGHGQIGLHRLLLLFMYCVLLDKLHSSSELFHLGKLGNIRLKVLKIK